MSHVTEIIEREKLSNGQFSIYILCCGEHEHRRTIGPLVEDVDASIAEAHRQAAIEHAAAAELDAKLKSLKGSKVEHQ